MTCSHDDMLYWNDEFYEKYCLVFPALLDITASYNVKEGDDVCQKYIKLASCERIFAF